MARATGGVYLDDEQKSQFEIAKGYVNTTVHTLHTLKVISDKRVNSTRSKLEKAIVKHIVKSKKHRIKVRNTRENMNIL